LILLKNTIKIALIFFSINVPLLLAQSEPDSTESMKEDSVFVMQKSAWGAVIRSAVLPGWGQIYNESYWKTPLFVGVIGGFVYGWIFYDDLYDRYSKLYSDSIVDGSGDGSYLKQRDVYRDQRDLMAVYIGITYFINLIDAYVDAHLFDFSVSENPHIQNQELNMKFYFNR